MVYLIIVRYSAGESKRFTPKRPQNRLSVWVSGKFRRAMYSIWLSMKTTTKRARDRRRDPGIHVGQGLPLGVYDDGHEYIYKHFIPYVYNT